MSKIFKIQGRKEIDNGVYYEVDCSLAPIGEGGMGRVFKGTMVSEKTGERRPVAVKFLYSDLPASVIQRAKREASIRIPGDDNLVEMIDMVAVQDKNTGGAPMTHLHVVSELLHGVMLHDLIKGRITDAEDQEIPYAKAMYDLFCSDRITFAVKIVLNILAGVHTLHNMGYIHRDIDPSNVMVTSDAKIKLIDFGIARAFGSHEQSLTLSGTFIGKPEYAAPELILGDINHQDCTTDIYAIGIVLFEMATGEQPFIGPAFEVQRSQMSDPLPLHKVPHPALRDIIAKATDKTQSNRYQTAQEFRAALEALDLTATQEAETTYDPYDRHGMGSELEVGGTQIITDGGFMDGFDNSLYAGNGSDYTIDGTAVKHQDEESTKPLSHAKTQKDGKPATRVVPPSKNPALQTGNTTKTPGTSTTPTPEPEPEAEQPAWRGLLPWAIGGIAAGVVFAFIF